VRVNAQNACSNDNETNVDDLNTVCFNQSSAALTTGVLAFTRVITENAPRNIDQVERGFQLRRTKSRRGHPRLP
jgi:hypothetical protein